MIGSVMLHRMIWGALSAQYCPTPSTNNDVHNSHGLPPLNGKYANIHVGAYVCARCPYLALYK